MALKSAFGCDGVSTRQHNEPAGNQDVWHHHTHVFPRWYGDRLYDTDGELVPLEEVFEVAALLRQHWPAYEPWQYQTGKPSAAGMVVRDESGRFLVLETTYRPEWNMPGGAVERHESPRDAAKREALEEIGLDLEPGRLLCADHRPTAPTDSFHFIFEGPVLTAEQIASIRLMPGEISAYRFVELDEALRVLNPPLAKRVAAGLAQPGVYLENGSPVTNPTAAPTDSR